MKQKAGTPTIQRHTLRGVLGQLHPYPHREPHALHTIKTEKKKTRIVICPTLFELKNCKVSDSIPKNGDNACTINEKNILLHQKQNCNHYNL